MTWDPVHNPNDPLIQLDRQSRTFKALVAPLDACILNGREGPGKCVRPPRDGNDYQFAHHGAVEVVIPWHLSHAPEHLTAGAAQDHYAHSGFAALLGRYYEDGDAIYAEGRVAPGVSSDDMELIAASALSGDWRWVEEESRLRMIASQVVNTPGFRPAYASLRASASDDGRSLVTYWEPITAAVPDYSTSAMVSLDFDPEDAASIAVPDGMPADDLHLTIEYLGDAAALDGAALLDALNAAELTIPSSITLKGLLHLGPNDQGQMALAWAVAGSGVQNVQKGVIAACSSVGVDDASSFSDTDYLPHVTASWSDGTPDMTEASKSIGKVLRVSGLFLHIGTDVQKVDVAQPTTASASVPDMACSCGNDIEAITAAVLAKVQESLTAAPPPPSPSTSTAPVAVQDAAKIDDGAASTGNLADLEQRVADLESAVGELISMEAGEPDMLPEAQLV